MCYMTTTTTVYTAPLSILPSIVSFSIPNAPIIENHMILPDIVPIENDMGEYTSEN
jgi:hypothetical protein